MSTQAPLGRNFVVTSQGVSATRWLAFVLGSNPKTYVAHGHFPLDSISGSKFEAERSKDDLASLEIGNLSGEFYRDASLDEVFAAYRKVRPDAEAYGNVHSYTLDALVRRTGADNALAGYAIANVIRHPVTYIESHTRLVRKAELHPAIYGGYEKDVFPTAVQTVPELLFVDCPDFREFFAFVVSCYSVLYVENDLAHSNVNHVRMETLTSEPASLRAFCQNLTGLDYPLEQMTSFIEKGPINRHRSASGKTDATAVFVDWPSWKHDIISLMLTSSTLSRFERAGYDVTMLREPGTPKAGGARIPTPCLADALKAIDDEHPLLKRIVSAHGGGLSARKRARIDVELIESRMGFNLVRAGEIFYALRQSMGPIDVSDDSKALLERYGPENVLVADSLDVARTRVDLLQSSQRIARLEALEPALTATRDELGRLRADIRFSTDANAGWRDITVAQILNTAQAINARLRSFADRLRSKAFRLPPGHGELKLIQDSKLFDAAWYLRRYPDVAASAIDPLLHYILHGAAEGRDPNPLFDSAFYRRSYPHSQRFSMSPLAHYIWLGVPEGCDPNPLFDTDWYLRENPEVAAMHCNPLLHYLERGAAAGRDPHPHFDTSRYLEENPALMQSGMNPLHHFLTQGMPDKTPPTA